MSEIATPGAQRPTFLTVLCIITALLGLWGVVGGVQTAFTDKPQRDVEQAREEIEKAMDEMGGDAPAMVMNMLESALKMAEDQAEKARSIGLAGLITSLLGLVGIWMMWNLRKTGFGIYTAASLAGLVVPLALLGANMVTLIGLGVGGLFVLLFIILFALNLKHMH